MFLLALPLIHHAYFIQQFTSLAAAAARSQYPFTFPEVPYAIYVGIAVCGVALVGLGVFLGIRASGSAAQDSFAALHSA
jgi:hypothetical protein